MFNHHHYKYRTQSTKTSGYTLVEILVVLMIIAILLALIVPSMGRLFAASKATATRATISQIDTIIQARYDAVMNADVSVEAKKLATLNSGVDEKEAEFIIRKILYRQALPQRPEDLGGFDVDLSTGTGNAPYASTWSGATASDDNPVTAAEVFFFAITQGSNVRAIPGGKEYPVPILQLDNINQAHIADNDNDDLKEFVDDWGQPFRFYNFPTHLFRPTGDTSVNPVRENASILISGLPSDTSVNGPLDRDPLDPAGFLTSEFTSDDANFDYAPGGSTVNRVQLDAEYYHVPGTYYVPLLVSAGPDTVLGLGEPTSTDVQAGPPIVAERLCLVLSGTGGEDIRDNLTNKNTE